MRPILNFLLKTISIIFWAIFIYLMLNLVINLYALAANFGLILENIEKSNTVAVLGTALSPAFTGLFVYLIAHFTWKWGSKPGDDLPLFEKIKISLGLMFNRY